MATAKKSVGFRLSETTNKEIEDIAKRQRVSQADVIAVLVHCYYLNDELNGEKINEWFGVARLS